MDWSAEEVAEEEGSPLARPRAVRAAAAEQEGSSSPPLRWVSTRAGSRSPPPSPRRRGSPGWRSPSRTPSPPRPTIMATSVRTIRRAPVLPAAAASDQEESAEVEDLLAELRGGSARPRLIPPGSGGGAGGSASVAEGSRGAGNSDDEEKGVMGSFSFQGPPVFDVEGGDGFLPPAPTAVDAADEVQAAEGGGGDGSLAAFFFPQIPAPPVVEKTEEEEEGGEDVSSLASFSFQQLPEHPVVDASEVLDDFAAYEEARKGKAAAEVVDAAMGANTGCRAEAIKDELVVNRRVLDIERLERWLRREEAAHELAWFADLCADEARAVPTLDLFESAFRALQRASAAELHRGADARRGWIGSVPVPEFFVCPLSKKIMEDPVVISSGKTVDRSALEEWLQNNIRICPVTGEILEHIVFIPNILMVLCISLWRAENGIDGLAAATGPPAISPQGEALFKEVTLMPHSPRYSVQDNNALRRLHKLIDEESAIVHMFCQNTGAIAKLASVLPETCLEPDLELDDIILGIMEKAAFYDPNKAAFGDDKYTIPVLIAKAWLGPVHTRVKCARILGLLADDYYNKIKIGELGGFAALIDLLSVGDIDVKKTVARAIAGLCEAHENWSRFLKEGVVDAAISLLQKDGLVLESQAILMLAGGFDLAMAQIIDKLEALSSDEKCMMMRKRLWRTFVAAGKSVQRRTTRALYSSSSTSAGDGEGSLDCDEQTKKDVKTIVSWLQKRCSYPRTYRYRN